MLLKTLILIGAGLFAVITFILAEHKNEFWEEIKKRWDEDVQNRRK